MCEAKRREISVFLGKVCQSVDDSGQLCKEEQQALAANYYIIHLVNNLISGLCDKTKLLYNYFYTVDFFTEQLMLAKIAQLDVFWLLTAEPHLRQEDVESITQHDQILRRKNKKPFQEKHFVL